MKKIHRVFCLFMILTLLLISCRKNDPSSDTEEETAGAYVKIAIPLDMEFETTGNMQVYDNVLYFCGMVPDNGDFRAAMIKIDLDDLSVQYDLLNTETSPYLMAVTENKYVFIFSNFPKSAVLRITDKDNNITAEKQVSDLITLQENQYDQICLASTNDKIYIAGNRACAVLNETGKTIDTYNLSGNVTSLLINSKGDVYIIGSANNNISLDIIDIKSGKIKSGNEFTDDLRKTGGFAYYIGDNNNIYIRTETDLLKYNFETKKTYKIINWVNTAIFAGGITGVIPLNDDNFILAGLDVTTSKSALWQLNKVTEESVPEKKIIRVSYMEDGTNNIPMAAIKFNDISAEYQVVCEEYRSVKNTDNYQELLSAYDADLLTGKIGDVLIMSNETDYEKYAKKGAFCDLYEFMNNDDTFSSDTLFECVTKSYETDGKLFIAIPEFTINTLVGKIKNLPNDTWNTKTMLDLADSLPDGVSLINGMTKATMLNTFLLAGAGEFIDFENSKCSFDSVEFISLIEYISSFPETMIQDIDMQDISSYLNDEVYLYETIYFGSFTDYLLLRARFGFDDEIEMIGYPSKQGGAAEIMPMKYYAVSSVSEQKAGAWEFIKFLLSGKNIVNEMKGMRYIPSSRDTFHDWLDSEQMLYYYFPDGSLRYRASLEPITGEEDSSGYVIALNDYYIEQFETFINNISNRTDIPVKITEIIREDIDIYFAGNKTAAETAQIIQNRIGIYVNENK